MKCIVHVGPPKTGSTFLQTFLRENKDRLIDSGVLALADNRMPKRFPYLFKTDESIVRARLRRQARYGEDEVRGIEEIRQIRDQTKQYISRQIEQHKPHTVIFSGESLALLGNNRLEILRQFLEEISTEYKIVMFLRRPDFKATSGYKNRIRHGGLTEEIGSDYQKNYDDGKTVKKLTTVFGQKNINPIISADSHPDKSKAEDHVNAFLKVIFGDTDTSQLNFVVPERRNTAWDYKAIQYMRSFNMLNQRHPDYTKFRKPLGTLLSDHFSGGEKIKIDKSVATKIISRYQRGWEFIRKNYFPEQKTLFHMDFSMCDDRKSSQHFGAEEAVLVSLKLMEDLLQQKNDDR